MTFALDLADFALLLLTLVLLGRVVMSWVFVYARDWRPRGLAALAIESMYVVTDPLIKPIRRVFPPMTLGTFRFDVAFMIVFFAVIALRFFLAVLRASL